MSFAPAPAAGQAGSAVVRALSAVVLAAQSGETLPRTTALWISPDSPLHGAALGGDGAEAGGVRMHGAIHLESEPASTDDTAARREQRDALWRERMRTEAAAAAAAMAEPLDGCPSWVSQLDVVPTEAPGVGDLLDSLVEANRDVAVAEAKRLAAVLALVGVRSSESSSAERQKADEIAHATGLSIFAAEGLIHRARMLAGPFEVFGAGLADGRVSFGHCLALIAQTADVEDPDTLCAIAEAAIRHTHKVVSDFRTSVTAIIAEIDRDALERRKRAKDRRTVYSRRLTDGMSFLGLTHQTQVINALMAQITDDGATLQASRLADHEAAQAIAAADGDTTGIDIEAAERGEQLVDGDLSPAVCRADALVARVLGQRHDDGTVTWAPSADQRVTVEVVIDYDTLRGLRDRVALLDGEPVPADVARELVGAATFVRRVVVDPVDDVVLDYGDKVYIPPRLRRFALARDGGCRNPSCTRKDRRFLQLDHAEEFPRGPSSADNCGMLCTGCHRRKTLGLFDITDSRADGSATITTAWGQTVRIAPRPYLPRVHEPDPPPVLEPPPF